MSKILILDIETAPGEAYIWNLWSDRVSIDMIKKHTRMICWSAKWIGSKEMYFGAEWEGGLKWLARLSNLMSEADAVVTQNGNKFDLPRIRGEFLLQGLKPPAPVTSIDTLDTLKGLGYLSAKLGYIGPLMKMGAKLKHEGFELWKRVEAGEKSAYDKMEKYNKQDVRLLERVYKKIRPFIKNHPHLGDTKPGHCPTCKSKRLQRRGERRTKHFAIERLHCQDCGSWHTGARRKIK